MGRKFLIFEIEDEGGGGIDLSSIPNGLLWGLFAVLSLKYGFGFIDSLNPIVGRIYFVVYCGYLFLWKKLLNFSLIIAFFSGVKGFLLLISAVVALLLILALVIKT
jgi:hypothetical protein